MFTLVAFLARHSPRGKPSFQLTTLGQKYLNEYLILFPSQLIYNLTSGFCVYFNTFIYSLIILFTYLLSAYYEAELHDMLMKK